MPPTEEFTFALEYVMLTMKWF